MSSNSTLEHWQRLAREARAGAADAANSPARHTLMAIAAAYDRLAMFAEAWSEGEAAD